MATHRNSDDGNEDSGDQDSGDQDSDDQDSGEDYKKTLLHTSTEIEEHS